MPKKFIPFFKVGNLEDSKGKKHKISKETFKKIIEATKNFSYQNDEFPIVIGHVKNDSPQWGSINKNDVKIKDGFLGAEVDEKNLVKEFVEWVKKGLYKTVSVSLRNDWSVKHLAFLGAKPPAVTGLPQFSFSEDAEDLIFEFEETEFAEVRISSFPFNDIKGLFRKLKNYFIELNGADEAEKLIPEYVLENVGNPPYANVIDNKDNTTLSNFKEAEKQTSKNNSEEKMDALKKLEAENKEFAEKNEELMNKLNVREQENKKLEAERIKAEVLNFCESEDIKKRLKPALKNKLVSAMIASKDIESFEFAEGTETKTATVFDTLKSLAEELPEFNFSEINNENITLENENSDIKIGEDIASSLN